MLDDIEEKCVPEAEGWIRAQKQVADKYGVQLVAYEGGPHLVADGPLREDEKLNWMFDEANRHPRMRAAYARLLRSWKQAGGQLYVHYASTSLPGKYGRWGAREQLVQDRASAPKLDALLGFIEQNPRWW